VNALLLQFVVWTLAGWIRRGQQSKIDYLVEENRVLREQMGKRRVRLTDDQRRRLTMGAKPWSSRASRRGRHCDSGHAAALVPKSGCEKVRRFPVQNHRTAEHLYWLLSRAPKILREFGLARPGSGGVLGRGAGWSDGLVVNISLLTTCS